MAHWKHLVASLLWVPLQSEEATLRQGRQRVAEGAGSRLAWNAAEFQVTYPSLATQLCIGGVYIRLLLEGADKVLSSANSNLCLQGFMPTPSPGEACDVTCCSGASSWEQACLPAVPCREGGTGLLSILG